MVLLVLEGTRGLAPLPILVQASREEQLYPWLQPLGPRL